MEFRYRETSSPNHPDDTLPVQIYQLELYGSFHALSDASYMVKLTGLEMRAEGSDMNGTFSQKEMVVFFYRNETYLRWDLFSTEADQWDEYLSYYDRENDISYGTSLHSFISIIDYPVYPLGEILTDHSIFYGDRSSSPRRMVDTSLTIFFTKG